MDKRKRTLENQKFGRWGEETASEYLQEQGVDMLAANVRTEYGEIDLLGQQDGVLIFFEVKTRRTRTFGYPEQSVDFRKQEHMRNAAQDYMQNHPEIISDWRIDVIAVEKQANKETKVTWFKHALSG